MTKRDFFIIIVKLFALYTLITTLFSVVPSLLAIYQVELDIYGVLYILCSLAFFSFIFMYLLNQSEKVVDFFKLDKGFDSDIIQIEKLNSEQIIKLGLIIIGGLTFLQYLPSLLTNCFYLFKSMTQGDVAIEFRTTENYVYITTDFIGTLLGYLIFTNHDRIAKKIF